MNWHIINTDGLETTKAMEIGTGVLVRCSDHEISFEGEAAVSESMCFVPDCRIIVGSCSERARVVQRTGIK